MNHQVLSFELVSHAIAGYLSNFRHYYPGIDEWFNRISPGFLSGDRRCIVVWGGGDIKGLAITKLGVQAKLCHISVSPKARDNGLGIRLMSQALADLVRSGAQEICVTTGEEVYREHGTFFAGAGFSVVDWHLNRYRRGVTELIWAASAVHLATGPMAGPVLRNLGILSSPVTREHMPLAAAVASIHPYCGLGIASQGAAVSVPPNRLAFEGRQSLLPFLEVGPPEYGCRLHRRSSFPKRYSGGSAGRNVTANE